MPNTLVKQAAILASASLIVRFIGFLYRIPLTALVGDEGNAFYVAAYTVYTLGVVITSGAMVAAVSKLVSERIAVGRYRDAHELFKNSMGAAIILGGIIAIIMALGANWLTGLRFFNYPGAAHAVRALAPTVFVVAMLAVFRGYFQGMRSMVPTAVSQIVEQIFNAAFSLWLAHVFFRTARIELAAAGAAAGTGIGVVAGIVTILGFYLYMVRRLRARAQSNSGFTIEKRGLQLKSLFFAALPIIVGMGIYQIANFVDLGMAKDRILASGYFTPEQVDELVGQFTGKFILLTTLPVSMSIALSQAVIPDISSSKATMDKMAVRDKINTALRVSMSLSIPAAVGLSVLAYPVLALLFPSHPDGGWLLRYGSVSIIFLALIQVTTGVLQGVGKFMLPVVAAFVGVLIKIPINWYLLAVPGINIMGLVISTLVCFVVASVINLAFIYKHTGVFPDIKIVFVRPIIAAAGMGVVCYATYYMLETITSGRIATMVALIVGVLVYTGFLWAIGGTVRLTKKKH